MQQMDELTLGVIPLGFEVSPSVSFSLYADGTARDWWCLLELVALFVVVQGWLEHSAMASTAKSGQMLARLSSCWCW